MRRLIHYWTTWNDGRNKSFKILEKIFGADTNGDGENTTRGVDEYVVTVNDETIKERSSDSEIQILGTSVNERQENFELPIHQSKDFIQIEAGTAEPVRHPGTCLT